MPLDDGIISREKDGFFNEQYCKWCYANGEYMYGNMGELVEVCVKSMANSEHSAEAGRAYLYETLPTLNY